jgi:acetyl esterase/lipase
MTFINSIITLILEFLNARANTSSEEAMRRLVSVNRRQGPSKPPSHLYKEFDIEEILDKGDDGTQTWMYILRQRGGNIKKGSILYLHGGAYILTASPYHWRFAAALARLTHLTIIVPLYPLAPEFTAVHTLLSAKKALQLAAREAGCVKQVVIVGGSAGGGLSLALTQSLLQNGEETPCALELICPFIDARLDSEEISKLANDDPMNSPIGLEIAAKWYAKDVSSPLVSPVLGNLENLPPISLWIGTRDILYPQCRNFKDTLSHLKQPLRRYREAKRMIHHWPVIDLLGHPEAKSTTLEIANSITDDLFNI